MLILIISLKLKIFLKKERLSLLRYSIIQSYKKSYLKNGGKGANQAVASALLNSKIIFAGQIGKDELG